MALFEDYAKKDDLDQEIKQAADDSQTRQEEQGQSDAFEMPERFRDKTPEEIAKSYVELETMNSRQSQDLGQMRSTMDEFLRNSVHPQADPQKEADPVTPVTIDELYKDADQAIARKVDEVAGNKIEQLEQMLNQERLNTRVESLDQRYPGWREKAQTPEFRNWMAESPLRMRLAQAADQHGDLDAAEELLTLRAQYDSVSSSAAEADREQKLADAGLESAGSAPGHKEQSFSRTKLTQVRILAQHGDQEAIAYLKENSGAIANAYNEGHITD